MVVVGRGSLGAGSPAAAASSDARTSPGCRPGAGLRLGSGTPPVAEGLGAGRPPTVPGSAVGSAGPGVGIVVREGSTGRGLEAGALETGREPSGATVWFAIGLPSSTVLPALEKATAPPINMTDAIVPDTTQRPKALLGAGSPRSDTVSLHPFGHFVPPKDPNVVLSEILLQKSN